MSDETVLEAAPEVVADAAPAEQVIAATEQPVEKPAAQPAPDRAMERMQRRIDELTYRLRETERQRAAPEPSKVEPKAPPTLEDVAFDEVKFRTAQAEWLQAEIDRKVSERLDKAEQQKQVKTREQTFREREKAFSAKNPDYAEKVYDSGTVPISDAMAEEITDSEFGPEIALYLATHLDVARQLYELPARQVAREMGRLEARFTSVKAAPAVPAVVKVSQAPPPAPKIDSADAAMSVRPDSPESDKQWNADEWAKRRNKQVLKKAKG